MKTALVVDDETMIRMQVREVLTTYGFDLLYEADNGVDALNLAMEHRPLVTVMDLSMPQMDGIDAANKMNKNPSGAIILLTGLVDADIIDRAQKAGIQQYLMKPFTAQQLTVSIDMAINQFIEISNLHHEVEKLKKTLSTRDLIARAKGFLIKHGMSEPEAHRRMQKLSMNNRKSMREIAEAILDGDT